MNIEKSNSTPIFVKLKKIMKKKLIFKCFGVLSNKDRVKLLIVAVLQVFLNFLDLLGVAAIGLIGALSVNGVQSKPPGTSIDKILNVLQVEQFTFQYQVAIVGVVATSILIMRTVLSLFVTRKMMFFLSYRTAQITSEMVTKLLASDFLDIKRMSSQKTLFAATSGVSVMLINVVGGSIGLVSDCALLLVMSLGLFIVDPSILISALILFGFVSAYLFKRIQRKVSLLGSLNAELTIESNEKITEIISAYRELYVHDRRQFYSDAIQKSRFALANYSAELAVIPNISKYAIEITLVLGSILVCAMQFILKDAVQAIATLTVFVAAASRIAPAILRIQTGAIGLRSAQGPVQVSLDLLAKLNETEQTLNSFETFEHKFEFIPTINIKDVSFKYPEAKHKTLRNISIDINSGEMIALVGPTGSGKTTVVDLALGVIKKYDGEILISGLPPEKAIQTWPGAISYVPQFTFISNSTIRENVAFGYNSDEIDDTKVIEALQMAQFFLPGLSMPEILTQTVGENGSRLSGGQRQRLGIARALYTKPRILILDEATSALDAKTEETITRTIQNLKGQVTLLIVAHRLSTIRHSDSIIYLEHGEILARGKFEDLRAKLKVFDDQAKSMGL